MIRPNEWYQTWFDSIYYHILYKNRDQKEAEVFLQNLLNYFEPKEDSFFLDLGCGKGRHSLYLANQGFDVLGVDLSLESILIARKKRQRNLSFNRMDMRDSIAPMQFDYILNLFTSFGYFDDDSDNQKVIDNIKNALTTDGKVVIDFLNAEVVKNSLIEEETKTIEDITFFITRKIEHGFVLKNIKFEAEGQIHNYIEKVKLIGLDAFLQYFDKAGLQLLNKFGNYHLNEFDINHSKRLILVAELKQ